MTVWQQAHHDALTGLPNMRLLRQRMGDAAELARRRHDKGLALLFVDLDRFKEVNDTLGHASGDALLIEAAGRLRGALRESDLVGRQGGDEFVVLLKDIADPQQAEAVAGKIVEAMTVPFAIDGHEIHLSASVGIALYPQDGEDVETLLRYADQAMYAAKEAGRSAFRSFSSEMQEQAARRRVIGEALQEALGRRQIELHYQPIVTLRGERVERVQAVLRWTHPDLGPVDPAEFLPIAADVGVIDAIGEWSVSQAIDAVGVCSRARPDRPVQIAINLSPRQIATGACQACVAALAAAAVDPRAFAVEITEATLLDTRPSVVDGVRALRAAGVEVSLAEFGRGHSALSHLRGRLIGTIKIDSALVTGLSSDPDGWVIVDAMIAMAHKLGLKVVAEGVRTDDQKSLLLQAGCDMAQGPALAEAMPLDAFADFLAAR